MNSLEALRKRRNSNRLNKKEGKETRAQDLQAHMWALSSPEGTEERPRRGASATPVKADDFFQNPDKIWLINALPAKIWLINELPFNYN